MGLHGLFIGIDRFDSPRIDWLSYSRRNAVAFHALFTNGLERWLGARLLRRKERRVPLDEGILLADGRFRYVDAAGQEQVTGPIINREFRKNSSQDWIVPLVRKLVRARDVNCTTLPWLVLKRPVAATGAGWTPTAGRCIGGHIQGVC